MIEHLPQPIVKERLQKGAGMVMVVDFDISGVGGAEKSAKAIMGYGKKADAKWALVSPYDVAVPLDQEILRIDGDISRGDSTLPQDQPIVQEQTERILKLIKEKNPQRIVLIQPRGKYMNSVIDALPTELLPKVGARWGSALDGPIVRKPDETDSDFEGRKERQHQAMLVQAKIANSIGVNLAISEAIKQSLVRAGVDAQKIRVITNQVGEGYTSQIRENDTSGEFRAKYLDPDEMGVLVASRVVRHKGLIWLLDLFKELNERHQDPADGGPKYKRIKIALVGDPKDQTLLAELQSMEKYAALPTTFTYLGSKTTEEMNSLYNAYDVLFHPSPSEGGPRVIPEAAKGGMMPIARVDCDGARELIKSGEKYGSQIGLLINSPAEAADSILSLMKNTEALNQYQTSAKSWANRRFDPEHIEHEFWDNLNLET